MSAKSALAAFGYFASECKVGKVLREGPNDCAGSRKKVERGPLIECEATAAY